MWGSDIGGYEGGGDVTPELLGRWAQFDALTPIFEVGGAGANATFWRLGTDAVERFRAAATLHYELVPYLYDLAQRASTSGLPPIRPLGLTWPDDGRVWAQDAEFTVGNSLLAAPVIVPATNGNIATTKVYLPPGRWIDFFTGQRLAGGQTVTRSSGPAGFPLYVHQGSALPANLRLPAVWSSPWRVNDLIRAGRQGWIVAPQPGVRATARSQAATLAAVQSSSGSITITLHHPAREQQVLVLTHSHICRVKINGAVVPRSSTATRMRSLPAGWLAEQAPPYGIVVKVHVGRAARINLRAC
jgi:alpha-D-xyloside xylohydrolase